MYKLVDGGVKRLSDGAVIPESNPNNSDWVAYQAWVNEGNTPKPMYDKDEAYAFQILSVNTLAMRKAQGTFDHLGNTFSLTLVNKVVKDKVRGKVQSFKVKDVNGKKVTFSSGDYDTFTDALIDTIDTIEDKEIDHLDALEVIYEDVNKTADDLLNYDITLGW